MLSVDFETRSIIDLTVCGTYVYADHPSTIAYCMAWAFDNDEPEIWRWFEGDPFPKEVIQYVEFGEAFRAWNVNFERNIWNGPLTRQVKNLPPLTIEQTYCTMTEALAMALPGKLEKAAPALKLDIAKDMKGNRIMQQLMKPRRARKNEDPNATYWWTPEEAPEKYTATYDYCKQDVVAERAVKKRVRDLSRPEQELFWYDQKINDRGVYIDTRSSEKLRVIASEAEDRFSSQLPILTDGYVTSNKQHIKFREWVNDQGVGTDSLDKAHVEYLLTQELPDKVKTALEIRQLANKSSVAKLDAFLNRTQADSRMRGNYQFCGAGSTGRWAARGAQTQNIPRGMLKDPDEAIDAINKMDSETALDTIELIYGNALDVIPSCLRGMLMAPPGHTFMNYDFSNIEGRMLAWLANEEWKLEAFRAYDRKEGPDLYILAYARSFKVTPDVVLDDYENGLGAMRHRGKTQELACGFGGSKGAIHNMAGRGVFTDDEAMELVNGWREANPTIKEYWYEVEKQAIAACKSPGVTTKVGEGHRSIYFQFKANHLWCRLPSKRLLCYPFAHLKVGHTPWGKDKLQIRYYKWDGQKSQWVRDSAWYGLIVENIVQAASRDVLAAAMLRVEAAGFPVVMHTHDELNPEIPVSEATEERFQELEKLMKVNPNWCPDLPISVEGWMQKRYKK